MYRVESLSVFIMIIIVVITIHYFTYFNLA